MTAADRPLWAIHVGDRFWPNPEADEGPLSLATWDEHNSVPESGPSRPENDPTRTHAVRTSGRLP